MSKVPSYLTYDFYYLNYSPTLTGSELTSLIYGNLMSITQIRKTAVLIIPTATIGSPTVTEYSQQATLLVPKYDLERDDIFNLFRCAGFERYYQEITGSTYANSTANTVQFITERIPELYFAGIHLADNPFYVNNILELANSPPSGGRRSFDPAYGDYLTFNINFWPSDTNYNQNWLDDFHSKYYRRLISNVQFTWQSFTASNDITGAIVPTVTLTSAGGTETLVNDGTGPSLAVKGVTAGANIGLTSDADQVTVAFDGVLPATSGGTGTNGYLVGDILAADTTTSLTKISDIAVGNVLKSGGVGVLPSYGKVNLSLDVTSTLDASRGGTSNSAYVTGDLLTANGATSLIRLADVAVGSVLKSGGIGVLPSYGQVDLSTDVTGVLPIANGGTGSSEERAYATGVYSSTVTCTLTGTDYKIPFTDPDIKELFSYDAGSNRFTYTGVTAKRFLVIMSMSCYQDIADSRLSGYITFNGTNASDPCVSYSKTSITFPENTGTIHVVADLSTGDQIGANIVAEEDAGVIVTFNKFTISIIELAVAPPPV